MAGSQWALQEVTRSPRQQVSWAYRYHQLGLIFSALLPRGFFSQLSRVCWGPAPSGHTHLNKLLLLLLRHLTEAVVLARQLPGQATQGFCCDSLHLPPFCPGAGWRQPQATDAAASPDPRGKHVALIKVAPLDLRKKRLVTPQGDEGSALCPRPLVPSVMLPFVGWPANVDFRAWQEASSQAFSSGSNRKALFAGLHPGLPGTGALKEEP